MQQDRRQSIESQSILICRLLAVGSCQLRGCWAQSNMHLPATNGPIQSVLLLHVWSDSLGKNAVFIQKHCINTTDTRKNCIKSVILKGFAFVKVFLPVPQEWREWSMREKRNINRFTVSVILMTAYTEAYFWKSQKSYVFNLHYCWLIT